MFSLEVGIMAMFWKDVLDTVNKTSKSLQSATMQVNSAIASVKSLKMYISKKRDEFYKYEELGAELTKTTDYKDLSRQHNVTLDPLGNGKTPQVSLTSSELFRTSEFLPIIDTFVIALDERISAYEEIKLRFGFLSRFDTLSKKEITEHAQTLIDIYRDDLDDTLGEELSRFQEFCSDTLDFDSKKSKISREQAMYSLILDEKLDIKESFPNVEMLLRPHSDDKQLYRRRIVLKIEVNKKLFANYHV